VAEAKIRTRTFHFGITGEGLCIGYDSGNVVSDLCRDRGRFDWNGGKIVKVLFTSGDDLYIDLERHLAAAMARD
jgi:hypothetical protein